MTENTTASQFLKQPQNAEYARSVKNTVIKFVSTRFNGFNQNSLSRVVNWFVKELIVQGISLDRVLTVLQNMWQNIGDYISGNVNNNQLMSKLNLVDYRYQTAVQDSEEWHESLAQKQRGKGAEGRVVVSLNNVPGFKGWNWVALDKSYCGQEGDAMGHCGNIENKGNILSLRDPEGYPHLTFINHQGVLGEMKGRGNSKPVPRYYPAIVKLLLSNEIGAIRGGGYAPKNNFDLSDLPEDMYTMVKSQKPYIDNPNAFEKKHHEIIQGLTKKTRGQLLKNSNVENVGQTVADLVNRNYDSPLIYDTETKDKSPEQVYKNNIWKMYTELLNAVYSRARTSHPEELLAWMDKMVESFVSAMVERDHKTWKESPPQDKQFFPQLSNIVKLDEMVYRLSHQQPEIMRSAPKRSRFGNWSSYIKALRRFLDHEGYELPGYRPGNHQISYEFNQKMAEEVARQGKGIVDLVNQAYADMDPRLSAGPLARHQFTRENPNDFFYGKDPSLGLTRNSRRRLDRMEREYGDE